MYTTFRLVWLAHHPVVAAAERFAVVERFAAVAERFAVAVEHFAAVAAVVAVAVAVAVAAVAVAAVAVAVAVAVAHCRQRVFSSIGRIYLSPIRHYRGRGCKGLQLSWRYLQRFAVFEEFGYLSFPDWVGVT